MAEDFVSVVIPCLNEAKTLKTCLDKCFTALKNLNIKFEVIVSDNGSEDGSLEIAKSSGAVIVNCEKKGYGNALLCGFKKAQGNMIIFADADDTYDFLKIPDFINAVEEDISMIIGSRFKGGIEKGAMPFLHRYFGTPAITFLINTIFKTSITDCLSGYRLIKKSALEIMELTAEGMEFITELTIECGRKNLKIKEIPITLHNDAEGRKPHLKTFRDGIRVLKLIVKKSNIY